MRPMDGTHGTHGAQGSRLAVGVMTGTSLDGLDAVAAGIAGRGLDLRATLLGHAACTLGPLADDLRRAADQTPMPAAELAAVSLRLAGRCAEGIEALGPFHRPPDLIAVHGQTVAHAPPVSWQMVSAAPIAARFGCPVVHDLRQADLAAGGQGAPITPLADWILFRGAAPRAIVNLGGFANVTVLPADGADEPLERIDGFDVCACNHVLDAAARTALGAPYDEGGRAAAAGRADADAVKALRATLDAHRAAGRSLGTGDEAREQVSALAARLAPQDLAATVVDALAACLAASIDRRKIAEIFVAGGGAHNEALVAALARHAGCSVRRTDALGVPVAAREALAIAVLGTLCADGIPITLPQVTGCRRPAPVAGAWSGDRSTRER